MEAQGTCYLLSRCTYHPNTIRTTLLKDNHSYIKIRSQVPCASKRRTRCMRTDLLLKQHRRVDTQLILQASTFRAAWNWVRIPDSSLLSLGPGACEEGTKAASNRNCALEQKEAGSVGQEPVPMAAAFVAAAQTPVAVGSQACASPPGPPDSSSLRNMRFVHTCLAAFKEKTNHPLELQI